MTCNLTSVHGVKCILYYNFPLEIRHFFLHDAQEGPQDWLVIPVHLAQDRLQGDMEQLDCEIQLLLAILKERKTDLKAGSSSVYRTLSSADATIATSATRSGPSLDCCQSNYVHW